MLRRKCIVFVVGAAIATSGVTACAANLSEQPGIVKTEFIFDKAPFAQCRASTIAQTKKGLVAAWFGGTEESHSDVGFWTSYHDGKEFGAIQPTLLTYADGRIQALCRSKQDRITESWSADGGKTWDKMVATSLPNPNAGIDAVTLADGRQLLVYNHTTDGRSPLNVAISRDGKVWKAGLVLEDQPGEYSYPAVIQTSDGEVHTTYTWKRRRIKHVVLDPAKLVLKNMVDGQWPK